jgi:hypothetical protein
MPLETKLSNSGAAMSDLKRNYYVSLRRAYQPDGIKLVIVAESPPVSGLYFYDPTGSISEPLFAALMRQLRFSALDKDTGLRELQRSGWMLVDATYEPVNDLGRTKRDRNSVIVRDYPLLYDDLKNLIHDNPTPLVLIKANVCQLLEPKLTEDNFNVINRGSPIYFPSHGRQREFAQQFGAALKFAGIDGAPT